MSKRFKLTPKQHKAFRSAQQEALQAMQLFESKREKFSALLDLLVEVHGIEGDMNAVQLDDVTGELFIHEPKIDSAKPVATP